MTEAGEAKSALGVTALLVAAVGLALALSSPPTPLPATAPATEFSAERAYSHVQVIAQTPRPAGTPASAAARAYLLEQLQKLDIPAEIVTVRSADGHSASEIHNVLAPASLVLVVTGLATNGVSATRPAFNCLAYGVDLDAGKAFWMSSDAGPDEWTAQFFPSGTPRAEVTDFFPNFRRPCLRAPALVAALAGADVRVNSDSIQNGRRRLSLRLTSPDHAPSLKVKVVSDTEILAASVFDQPVSRARRGWEINFNVFPRDGAELVLELPPDVPLTLTVVEQHFGLPDLLGVHPRPEYLICEPNTLHHNRSIGSDQMLVIRTFRFPPAGGGGG